MKRPRDAFDSSASSTSPPLPPSKRRALPATPLPHPLPPLSLVARSPWVRSVPHDSPSNPFGLNRALRALDLPRASGFGKHIVLRCQLVDTSSLTSSTSHSRKRHPHRDAPHRVIQVPLNYSFRLFHELLLFLFATDASIRVRRPRRVFSPSLIPHPYPAPPRKPQSPEDAARNPANEKDEHFFEVFNDVSVYAYAYRPGVIKPNSGRLYARLSSARERKLFADPDDAGTSLAVVHKDDIEDDVFDSAPRRPLSQICSDQQDGTDNDAEEEWDWEAEDDFVLSNVWPDGPDIKKGLIYHHTPTTAIHITVNQQRVPSRKGTGNTPYVFSAHGGTRGAVRIAHVVQGPMPSEAEIAANMEKKSKRKGRSKRRRYEDSDSDESNSDEENKKKGKAKSSLLLAYMEDHWDEVDDLEEGETAAEEQLARWNEDNAFERFLAREGARERAIMRRHAALTDARKSLTGSTSVSAKERVSSSLANSYYTSHSSASHSSSRTMSTAPSSPSTLPILLPSSDFDGDAEAWSDLDYDRDAYESSPVLGSPTVTYTRLVICDSSASSDSPHSPNSLNFSTGTHTVHQGVYTYVAPVVPSPASLRKSARRSRSAHTTINARARMMPVQTPFPASPGARRRVARHSKRLERQTSKGLSGMDSSDEEERAQDGKQTETEKDGQEREKEASVEKGKTADRGRRGAYEEEDQYEDDDDEDEDEEETSRRPAMMSVFAPPENHYQRNDSDSDSEDDEYLEADTENCANAYNAGDVAYGYGYGYGYGYDDDNEEWRRRNPDEDSDSDDDFGEVGEAEPSIWEFAHREDDEDDDDDDDDDYSDEEL